MKKNGAKNANQNYRNGVKIETILNAIFVKNAVKQRLEKGQK